MTARWGVFLLAGLVSVAITMLIVIWWDANRPVSVVIQSDPDATIAVQIEGAVASPGVVFLAAGGRLEQAIAASGGLRGDADVSRVYLAARVGDGERIVIPTIPPPGSSLVPPIDDADTAPVDATGDSSVGGLININLATAEDLEALPGVGEVLASRIVAYRDEHGPFSSIDELGEVEGIGPTLLEALRPLVTVGE